MGFLSRLEELRLGCSGGRGWLWGILLKKKMVQIISTQGTSLSILQSQHYLPSRIVRIIDSKSEGSGSCGQWLWKSVCSSSLNPASGTFAAGREAPTGDHGDTAKAWGSLREPCAILTFPTSMNPREQLWKWPHCRFRSLHLNNRLYLLPWIAQSSLQTAYWHFPICNPPWSHW